MRTLYLECNMGCAGDMLSAALYELLDESQQQTYLQTMNNLGLHGVTVSTERVARCGVYGTHMVVSIDGEEEHAHDIDLTASTEHDHDHDHSHGEHEHHHEHEDNDHHHHDHDHGRAAGHHTHEHEHGDHEHGHEHHHHHGAHLADIFALIDAANVSDAAKANAKRIYQQIAEAEAHAHNADIQHIHFHEVGTKDAVVDVLGCCVLLDMLHPDRVVCSPVNVGSGQVRCAHGIVPVPAPATAFLLQNAPSYGSSFKGELCTPTGAALLTAFAHSFGAQPLMKVQATGYGCGTKEFEAANLVRAMLGDAFDASASADSSAAAAGKEPLGDTDRIVQLSCNLDDMTGEEIAFATQALLDAGALDVFTSAISMKKNRPAVLLCCLCKPADKQRFAQLIFKHTTTLGVRETLCNRYVLARKNAQRETPFGTVGYKQSEGYGATTEKADFDDLAAIAKREGLSLREVKAGIAHGLENE